MKNRSYNTPTVTDLFMTLSPRTQMKFSDKPLKSLTYRRPLREFPIKGQKIMAYSRKDAITRLKHKQK